MLEKKRDRRRPFRLAAAVRLVWDSARGGLLANVALMVPMGILPLAGLYLMKRMVDSVTAAVSGPHSPGGLSSVLTWVALAGGVALLTALCRSLSEVLTEHQALVVTDHVSALLHAHSVEMDLEYYDNPQYHDTLHRAQREAPYRPSRIVGGLIQVGQNGAALLGTAGILLSVNWLVGLLLFLVAIPSSLVRMVYSRRLYELQRKHTEKERRAWYHSSILTGSEHAKEVRLLDLGPRFQERFRILREELRFSWLSLARQRALGEFATQVLVTVALFGALAFVAGETIRGKLTIGSLVMYYQGLYMGIGYLQGMLRSANGLYEDHLFLHDFYQFLDLRPRIVSPRHPKPVPRENQRGISFAGVGFTYPNSTQPALHDIDLQLEPGRIVALVGENGSGKTTLAKLICRLHDPTTGRISCEGVDLRDFDLIDWRKETSVLLQDYVHYQLSARENIELGDISSQPGEAVIARAAQMAGADTLIRALPDGYDTVLGTMFEGGHELSVGEWQKIALSRVFLRSARILILDEPSSALDPIAEAELFHRFRDLFRGRSVLLISHRFSTVSMADHIVVLENGTIAESGAHQALLQLNGRYSRLYRSQVEAYDRVATAPESPVFPSPPK